MGTSPTATAPAASKSRSASPAGPPRRESSRSEEISADTDASSRAARRSRRREAVTSRRRVVLEWFGRRGAPLPGSLFPSGTLTSLEGPTEGGLDVFTAVAPRRTSVASSPCVKSTTTPYAFVRFVWFAVEFAAVASSLGRFAWRFELPPPPPPLGLPPPPRRIRSPSSSSSDCGSGTVS